MRPAIQGLDLNQWYRLPEWRVVESLLGRLPAKGGPEREV